jgi:pilus assembly protein CpaF
VNPGSHPHGGSEHAAVPSFGALVDEAHELVLAGDVVASGPVRRAQVIAAMRNRHPLMSGRVAAAVADRVLARIDGLGALAPLLADPDVTDVLVNGPGPVWIERAGELVATEVVLTTDDIDRLLERVLAPLGLRIDRSSPLVDARLADGSRVNAVVPPLAVDGPCVAIRKFAVRSRPLSQFAPVAVADLLGRAVEEGRNIVISGGTGAGKTSLLDALAALLPTHQRLVTVEDVAELGLTHAHVVRLETRPASADGVGRVGIRELVRNALRLRPDRIIVGEVRGAEALDMLQAMNTGHDGSLTTLHANRPDDAVRRLETMVLLDGSGLPLAAVREQIASAVDLIVQVSRHADGARRVSAIAEPSGALDTEGRVELRELVRGGALVAAPRRPARARAAGGGTS